MLISCSSTVSFCLESLINLILGWWGILVDRSWNRFHSIASEPPPRMIPMDSHFVPPSTSTTTGLVFPANYSVSGLHPAVDSPVAGGIKPEAALVMDWSLEEQYVLENGLAK